MLSDGTVPEALAASVPAADGTLIGMAAAPGTATGRARVILDPTDARIDPGEVLVAPTTDPGWTPLFLTAAGLVTETGSPMAHGPTVAREYGIPAVICVRDATSLITTGQMVTIDGAAGTVLLGEMADGDRPDVPGRVPRDGYRRDDRYALAAPRGRRRSSRAAASAQPEPEAAQPD